jgi:hypothetical protein
MFKEVPFARRATIRPSVHNLLHHSVDHSLRRVCVHPDSHPHDGPGAHRPTRTDYAAVWVAHRSSHSRKPGPGASV